MISFGEPRVWGSVARQISVRLSILACHARILTLEQQTKYTLDRGAGGGVLHQGPWPFGWHTKPISGVK